MYHTVDALFAEVTAFATRNPRTVRLETLRHEQGGYSVEFPVLTVVPGGLAAEVLSDLEIGASSEGGGAAIGRRRQLDAAAGGVEGKQVSGV